MARKKSPMDAVPTFTFHVPEITSRLSPGRGKARTYCCDLCGIRVKLKPGRHWCGCNPSAPFEMMDAVVHSQAIEIANGLTRLIGYPPESVSGVMTTPAPEATP